jgi:hypothetical protein
MIKGGKSSMKTLTVLLAVQLLVSTLFAQTAITSDSPRPLADAVQEVAKLSGFEVNYEDVRVQNRDDIQDVTDTISRQPTSPGDRRTLVPRGGKLSVSITVDPTSKTLPDTISVQTALSALVAAYNASSLPGKFRVDAGNINGVFYITPTQGRSAIGAVQSVTPVLSTRITLKPVQQVAYLTLEAILNEVSRASRVQVGIGTIPIRVFAVPEVMIAADNEPANEVLARLFAAVSTAGSAALPAAVPAISYLMFYDPGDQSYVFNVLVTPSPNVSEPLIPPTPPPPDPSRFFTK